MKINGWITKDTGKYFISVGRKPKFGNWIKRWKLSEFSRLIFKIEESEISDNLRMEGGLKSIQPVTIEIRKMNEWQPIETAPKDETLILTWDGMDREIRQFRDGRWIDQEGYCFSNPTHWAPLIEPPKEKS